jgi:hypothetical protein
MATKMAYWARIAYLVGAWLFLMAVLSLVFLAGLSLFVSRTFWGTHAELGRAIGFLAPSLLVLAFLGRLPRATVGLTALLVILYAIQWTLVGLQRAIPVVAALHAVNALALFWVALTLARRAWALARAARGKAFTPQRPADATEVEQAS